MAVFTEVTHEQAQALVSRLSLGQVRVSLSAVPSSPTQPRDTVRVRGVVRDIGYEELLTADEVFLCNSLYGVWPVRRFAGHDWSVGPLTRKLQAIVCDLLSK